MCPHPNPEHTLHSTLQVPTPTIPCRGLRATPCGLPYAQPPVVSTTTVGAHGQSRTVFRDPCGDKVVVKRDGFGHEKVIVKEDHHHHHHPQNKTVFNDGFGHKVVVKEDRFGNERVVVKENHGHHHHNHRFF